MRSLNDLINVDDPGMPIVQEWIAAATRPVEVLPAERTRADSVLHAIQITTRSAMGAIAHETGGILIDHGWLRILGSGHERLPRDLASWNRITLPSQSHRLSGAFLIADDILGGFFAANGGALGPVVGVPTIFYFAPDTLEWQGLGIGYSDFVSWTMQGALDKFYESFRWPGWKEEVSKLNGDQALSIYPFLSATGGSIAERSRKPVSIEEIWRLHVDA